MAVLNVLTEPNGFLRKRSKEITEFSSRLHEILDDMAETMRDYDGVGIAAVQVGILWRACLVSSSQGICELVNPVIIKTTEQMKASSEGCLSVPEVNGIVLRPQEVTVRAQDRHGKFFERTFTNREAVCVCHELDHLDGVLFTDKIEKKTPNNGSNKQGD